MAVGRIAERYAGPLLDLAQDQKVEDAVKSDMEAFVKLCQENREFVLMLKSPVIPHLRKGEILKKIFQGKIQELTGKFFEIIVRKNRESILPEVAGHFLRLYNESKGIQEAKLTTSVAIDSALRKDFEKLVKSLSGKEPELEERVEPEILGGYQLELGDRKIDSTVRGQLRSLKLRFSRNNN